MQPRCLSHFFPPPPCRHPGRELDHPLLPHPERERLLGAERRGAAVRAFPLQPHHTLHALAQAHLRLSCSPNAAGLRAAQAGLRLWRGQVAEGCTMAWPGMARLPISLGHLIRTANLVSAVPPSYLVWAAAGCSACQTRFTTAGVVKGERSGCFSASAGGHHVVLG